MSTNMIANYYNTLIQKQVQKVSDSSTPISIDLTNTLFAKKTANVGNNFNLKPINDRVSSILFNDKIEDNPNSTPTPKPEKKEIVPISQGGRNARDGISLIQAANNGLEATNKNLARMKELAKEASNDALSDDERIGLDAKYQSLALEITNISKYTTYNSINLLDGSATGPHDGTGFDSTGSIRIHFGSSNKAFLDYTDVSISDSSATALSLGNVGTAPNSSGSNILTKNAASASIGAVETAIITVDMTINSLASTQKSLGNVIDRLNKEVINSTPAKPKASDADITKEKTIFIREQFFVQSSIDALSLSSDSPDMIFQMISKET